MIRYASFALGFAAGWSVRATTESSRATALDLFAAALTVIERLRRAAAIERDHLEDLVAEARARADVFGRERGARVSTPSSTVAEAAA